MVSLILAKVARASLVTKNVLVAVCAVTVCIILYAILEHQLFVVTMVLELLEMNHYGYNGLTMITFTLVTGKLSIGKLLRRN
jgi:hypothetical protein